MCRFLVSLVILACSIIPQILSAQASSTTGLAFERAKALQHGINLSGWFSGSGDLTQQHLDTYITEADFKLIHAMGFDSVRLGIDPTLFTHNQDQHVLQQIDHAIGEAIAEQLAVTIVVFPNDDYKHGLANNARAVDDFVLLWRVLAEHLAATNADKVFYELINEPEVQDPYRWMGIQARVVAAIRRIDAKHTIIASGANYSDLEDLLAIEPVNDNNVIYNFHFYEPYPFTHQGASWGSSEWVYYKDIPYPATPEALAEQMKHVPDDLARYYLFLYGAGGWNRQSIASRLGFAAMWAKERNVPIIANEFGVFRDTADAASRTRWIEDVRSALEENHIGWAMWDYCGNFGVVKRSDTGISPDAAVLRALGLRPIPLPEPHK